MTTTPSDKLPQLTLLAGGRGSRMGGDKLLLRLPDGTLIVDRWLRSLNWAGPLVVVRAPGVEIPDGLPVNEVIHDTVADEGPLRGVATAMESGRTAWHLVLPIDMPGVGREQLDWLAALSRQHPDAKAILVQRRVDVETMIEPLPMLVHVDMKGRILARLGAGRRSLQGLAKEPDALVVDAPNGWPASVWRNINRPDDLAAYLAETTEGETR